MTSYTSNARYGGVRSRRASLITSAVRRTVVILLLTSALSGFARGWSNPGHMAVALVAYNKLDQTTRARVDVLVAMNPKINAWRAVLPTNASEQKKKMMLFMIAATWADQIKGDGHISDGTNNGNTPPADGTGGANLGYSDNKMRKYWHFNDVAFSTDGTPLINPPIPNAETQINLFRNVLASNTASDALKSYDLVWLLHLVGDIHQPLHSAARFTSTHPNGDDGGNGVTVCDPSCGRLHSYWDGLFGSTPDLKDGLALALKVPATLPPAPSCQANDLVTANWVQEGFALSKMIVYENPPIKNGSGPFNLTSEYGKRARIVAANQVALAGARLAHVLNNELR